MALVSVPFVLIDRPLLIVISFTILGSVLIPFLAATLLYLNNRVDWPGRIRHNGVIANGLLTLILLLFLGVGGFEIFSLFRSA